MAKVSGASLLNQGISTSRMRVVNESIVFAKEDIWLNGYKVKIGGSFSHTARAINRHSTKTAVKAIVVDACKSSERLKLIARGGIAINDPKALLLSLYRGKKIGTSDDMLIQIVSSNNSRVKFTYNNTPIKNLTSALTKLSEGNTKAVTTQRLPSSSVVIQDNPTLEDEEEIMEAPVDPAIRLEYLRRSREIMAQSLDRAHREMAATLGETVVKQVIQYRNLPNTSREQIDLTNRAIAEEIYSSEIGEEFLKRNSSDVETRISKQIDSNRDKLSSAFEDKLVISEPKIRESVRLALQQIKLEQYTSMAADILNGFGRITIAKPISTKLSGSIVNGLLRGREISFDVVYNSYPKVREKISGLVIENASQVALSRGQLNLNDTKIGELGASISRLRVIDLGLV